MGVGRCCGAGGGGWNSRRQKMGRVGTPWLELVFQAVRVRHLLSAPYSLRPWGWELYVAHDTDRSPEVCWEKD